MTPPGTYGTWPPQRDDGDLGEHTTHPVNYIDDWQSREAQLGFWRVLGGVALYAVVVLCCLVVVTWLTRVGAEVLS